MSQNTQVAERPYTSPFMNDLAETQPSSIVPAGQTSTALAKPAVTAPTTIGTSAPAADKVKSKNEVRVRLPIVVEAAMAFSWAIIVTTGAIAVMVTFRSRSSGLEFFLRSGTVTIVAGVLLLFFAWMVVRGCYEIMLMERKEAERAKQAQEAEEMEGTEAESLMDMDGDLDMPSTIESEGNQTEAEL